MPLSTTGVYGSAASNDIIPNGPVVPLDDISLPGSIDLKAVSDGYGRPAVLALYCTTTFRISSLAASPTKGALFPAATLVYFPANRTDVLYFNGAGTLSATLLTNRNSEA